MKDKRTYFTVSSCFIVVFVASFFLLNSAYAGKDCGASDTSKARTVVAPAQEQEQHVDEHAGHGHPSKNEHKEYADEHDGHDHDAHKESPDKHIAPKDEHPEHMDEHAGHKQAPKE